MHFPRDIPSYPSAEEFRFGTNRRDKSKKGRGDVNFAVGPEMALGRAWSNMPGGDAPCGPSDGPTADDRRARQTVPARPALRLLQKLCAAAPPVASMGPVRQRSQRSVRRTRHAGGFNRPHQKETRKRNLSSGLRFYLMPTTIESGPTRCSTRVWRKPTWRIHPSQSAPV